MAQDVTNRGGSGGHPPQHSPYHQHLQKPERSSFHSNISNHNDNYSDSIINYHTTSTISSPQSHHLHHQGYGGASSSNSSHSINNIEESVESILALSPLPIFYKVPGLNNNEIGYLKNNLPPTYTCILCQQQQRFPPCIPGMGI